MVMIEKYPINESRLNDKNTNGLQKYTLSNFLQSLIIISVQIINPNVNLPLS